MTPLDIKAAERKYWFFVYLTSAPLLLLLFYKTELSQWVSILLANAGISVSASTVALVQFGTALVIFFAVIFRGQYWFLARCPKCAKPIYPNNVGIVIATKNCPNCGAQVISNAQKT